MILYISIIGFDLTKPSVRYKTAELSKIEFILRFGSLMHAKNFPLF